MIHHQERRKGTNCPRMEIGRTFIVQHMQFLDAINSAQKHIVADSDAAFEGKNCKKDKMH